MKTIKLNKEYEMIVDDEDFSLLSNFTWYISDQGYAKTSLWKNGKVKQIRAHHLIMKLKKGYFVDHINCNKLDNRRENLRLATNAENMRNRDKNKNNTSGYKGVTKFRNKWIASLRFNYKKIYLGIFKEKEDAAKAYNIASNKFFGSFSRVNKIIIPLILFCLPLISYGQISVQGGGTGKTSFSPNGWIYANDSTFQRLNASSSPTVGYITGTTTATSTLAGGLQALLLRVTSTIASSTFSNGINLTSGCFSINGICLTTSSGGTVTAVTATAPIFSSGGNTPNISWAGLATTSQPSPSNLLVSNGTSGIYGVATSTLTPSSPLTGSFTQIGSGGSIGLGTVGIANGGTNSTSISSRNVVWFDGTSITATGTVLTVGSLIGTTTATSTLTGGLSANILNTSSTTASSTFANGINLTKGCFSINGVCAGTGNGTVNTGTYGQYAWYASDGTTVSATGTQLTVGNINATSTATSTFNWGAIFAIGGGNVGIGTTSPFAKLSVSANASDAYNRTLFAIASSTGGTATTTPFIVLANGNTGIGTTTPSSVFSVAGDIYGTGKFGIGTNDFSGGYRAIIRDANSFNNGMNDVLNLWAQSSGGIADSYGTGITFGVSALSGNQETTLGRIGAVLNGSSGDLVFLPAVSSSGIEKMRLASTGNLGIGTTSPYSLLSVAGQVVAQNYIATGTATSTFTGGFQTDSLRVSSTTATSTFNNGINATAGCFSINGVCIGSGSGSGTVNTGSSLALTWYASGGTAVSATGTTITVGNLISTTTATSTFAGSLSVSTTSAQAFSVNDQYGSNVLNVNTSSTTGNILEVQATSSTRVLFSIDQYGHMTSSSSVPTLSSGTIDGTDNGGVVTSCTTACTITFAKAWTKTPACEVTPDTGSVVNTLSITRSTTALVVTETGLGTFSFHCGMGI